MYHKHSDEIKLDEIDYIILKELQTNSNIKRNELSEKTGLSLPSTIERISKLESSGYIEKYNAILNPKKLNYDITCFVFVVSESSKYYSQFVEHCNNNREILECHSVTGEGSHILKIRTRNTTSLEKLLSEIQSWPGVKSSRTSIVLTTHKETMQLDLNFKHGKKKKKIK